MPYIAILRYLLWSLVVTAEISLLLPAQVRGSSGTWPNSAASSSTSITVSGQVVNARTGAPIPRALIRLSERAALTDHEGKFRFDQFTGPGGALQVIKPGFYLSTDPSEPPTLFLPPDQLSKPILVRLYPEALLTGTITAPDGDPLPRIFVTARRSVVDEMGRRLITAGQGMTDTHGNFRLAVPSGDYRLETRYTTQGGGGSEVVLPVSVPGPNQLSTFNAIHISSGEEQHFDLHPATTRAYNVTAKLESFSERGFPGVTARASTGVTIPVNFQRGTGPDEGRMQLPSGTYILTANVFTPDGGEQAETTVTVPDHDISGVILHMSPNPSIPIELTVDSAATSDKLPPAIQQLGLTLLPTQVDSDRGNGMVGAAIGRSRTPIFNTSPGTYRLQARNNGEWYVKSATYGTADLLQQDLVVASGNSGTPIRISVSDQTGSLQGVVRLNGSPAHCWIYLIPVTPGAEPVFIFRSGSDGTYRAPYLPPGDYRAIAFERRRSVDYRAPEALDAFTTHLRSFTLNAGDKATFDLDAVSAEELSP